VEGSPIFRFAVRMAILPLKYELLYLAGKLFIMVHSHCRSALRPNGAFYFYENQFFENPTIRKRMYFHETLLYQ